MQKRDYESLVHLGFAVGKAKPSRNRVCVHVEPLRDDKNEVSNDYEDYLTDFVIDAKHEQLPDADTYCSNEGYEANGCYWDSGDEDIKLVGEFKFLTGVNKDDVIKVYHLEAKWDVHSDDPKLQRVPPFEYEETFILYIMEDGADYEVEPIDRWFKDLLGSPIYDAMKETNSLRGRMGNVNTDVLDI